MASKLVGRVKCPECGFEAAHVKINTDKEGARHYRHCPDCSSQFFPRSDVAEKALLDKMRTDNTAPKPDATDPATGGKATATGDMPVATTAPTPTPTPAPRRGLFR